MTNDLAKLARACGTDSKRPYVTSSAPVSGETVWIRGRSTARAPGGLSAPPGTDLDVGGGIARITAVIGNVSVLALLLGYIIKISRLDPTGAPARTFRSVSEFSTTYIPDHAATLRENS